MRSRSSCWRPVISASAMTSAMTPTVTRAWEIRDDRDERLLPFGEQIPRATWSSKGRSNSLSFSHQREQNHVSDRWAIGQEHHEPIDADAFAAGRRQAVLERPDVIFVHRVRFEVAARAVLELRLEPPAAARPGR